MSLQTRSQHYFHSLFSHILCLTSAPTLHVLRDLVLCMCFVCFLPYVVFYFVLSCMLILIRRDRFLSSASAVRDDGFKKGFVLFLVWNLGGLRLRLKNTAIFLWLIGSWVLRLFQRPSCIESFCGPNLTSQYRAVHCSYSRKEMITCSEPLVFIRLHAEVHWIFCL